MQKELLECFINEKKTVKQMAKESGVLIGKLRYWLQKYNLRPVFSREFGVGARRKWTDEQMFNALKSSSTISEVLRKLGLKVRPGNYSTVKKFVKYHNIDLTHMTGKSIMGSLNKARLLADIMVVNSQCNRCHLKSRLLKEKLLKNECCLCGINGIWCGRPIIMVLDHINGIGDDNRLENLRMLCPNCNSQQKTFCRKNGHMAIPKSKKGRCLDCGSPIWDTSLRCSKCLGLMLRRAARPSKEDLEKMISTMTWVDIGKKYGVSDNSIKKWAWQCGIDYAPRKLM